MFTAMIWIIIIYTIVFNIYISASSDEYYGTYTTYNDICFKRNVFAWLPLISTFLIFLGILFFANNFDNIAKMFFIMLFSGVLSVISSIHTSHHNISIGDFMDQTDTERYQKEVVNEVAGTASLIAGTYSVIKHTAKGIKEITDVDSWKKMK